MTAVIEPVTVDASGVILREGDMVCKIIDLIDRVEPARWRIFRIERWYSGETALQITSDDNPAMTVKVEPSWVVRADQARTSLGSLIAIWL